MKKFIEVIIIGSQPALTYDPITKTKKAKLSKEGKPVFELFYNEKSIKEINGKKFESTEIKKLSSNIDVPAGLQLLEIVEFVIEGKLFVKIIDRFVPSKN